MSTWWTSDTHFMHKNIIEYSKRPFLGTDEMDAILIDRHNAVVKPGDTVYHLGDFSLSKKALPLVRLLNGDIHLVPGNHDHCHPVHAKDFGRQLAMTQLYIDAGFKSIQLEATVIIAGAKVLMHHMPYAHITGTEADAKDRRYLEYRPVDTGLFLLHGHVHERWKRKGKMLNVGVDVWGYRPVSYDEVLEQMKEALNEGAWKP